MSGGINCEESYFRTSHGKVYFLKYEGRDSSGVPLIMIHGGPGFTHHYLEPLFGLANERPVIFYDQLGCGKSDRPQDLSFCSVDYFVSELRALVEHLGYTKVSLLGHSWGSTVASEYAIQYSDVSHLILASPYMSSPLWNRDSKSYIAKLPKDMQANLKTRDTSSEAYLRAHTEYYDRHVYGTAREDRSIALSTEEASNEIYHTLWGKDEICIDGILKDYDCRDRISEISAKTLFTCGEYDTGGPKSCKEMSRQILDSRLKVFPDCAHFPHLECKLDYVTCIRNFLNDQKIDSEEKSLKNKLVNFLFK